MSDYFRRFSSFVMDHRAPLRRGALLALMLVVILQNLEPTKIDFLFWSLPDVPKLVVILTAMALGAVVWEMGLRLWQRGR